MNYLLLLLPAIIGLSTGVGSMIVLSASKHILADDGEQHLAGWGYRFDADTYKRTLLTGGLLGIGTLYLIPYYLTGTVILHWIPILMVVILTVQSVIDLTYFELADEWNIAFAILSFSWAMHTTGITSTHLAITFGLFSLFYLSWFFTDFPGYGDVKMVFAGGVLIESWIGAYQFVFISTMLAVIGTFISCWLDKKPMKEWTRTQFAYGPYLALAYLIIIINSI